MISRQQVSAIALVFVLDGFVCAAVANAATKTKPSPTRPSSAELDFFEKKVRPLLAEHCYSCHSVDAKKVQAGLLVDSRTSLLAGGDSGEAIVPGDADDSLLVEAVRYESYEMPPQGKLPDADIETFERWVEMGAPWPEEPAPASKAAQPEFNLQQRKAEHWVWQPIEKPAVPQVRDTSWPNNDVDHFILHHLEQENFKPARDASRSALVRRLFFDLIGLPPSPDEVDAFLRDETPTALQSLVDRLLASPHFGERWGRHWLDVVRYAESRGHEFDNDAPNAYQYRDYVIRALNEDVPYDQFVREHIAGDLLKLPRLHPKLGFNESILGTGFWFLGEWVHSPVDIRKDESDRFDNMIDVMSKAFLGVTVSCARCHDHKFDAISTADYYSLTGFLQSSDFRQVRFESIEKNRSLADRLHELDTSYRTAIHAELASLGYAAPSAEPLPEELQEYVVVRYGSPSAEPFRQDGFVFGKHPRTIGTPYLLRKDEGSTLQLARRSAAVNDPFWHGLESVSERGQQNSSKLVKLPRSGRTLCTPTFELRHGTVACRVRGSGHVVACVDSHRMVSGPLHGETIKKIEPKRAWVELNLHRYIGHRLHLEFTPDEDTELEVSLVTQGASAEVRKRLDEREKRQAAAVEAINLSIAQLLADGTPKLDGLRKLIDEWSEERQRLRGQIVRRSKLAMAIRDGTGEEAQILIRGNSSKPGRIEPRHFLTAVSGDVPMEIEIGSGRLQLAREINDPKNPLTTRVIANRVWHHLLGRGIVPTTDDFGVLGERPTHPQLLDHLAVEFVERGQSIKQLIRYIVLSRTYQMSSFADLKTRERDPKNLLWHHRPPQRLESEVIRDSLLAVSGQLDSKQFGEPVPVHLTAFMDGRGRPRRDGPLDGARRRSIYLAVRRNFLSPFMLTFDTPVPFSAMGRRNVSNVPAQALILMNDPFVADQASKWAMRVIEQHDTFEPRIAAMYQSAFARQPTVAEIETARQFFSATKSSDATPLQDDELWTDYAHALINTKEFVFLP